MSNASYYADLNLHSTMFLLIPESGENVSVTAEFTFHNVSINSNCFRFLC